MSPGSPRRLSHGQRQRFLRKRHFFPSNIRHILNCRFRWNFSFLVHSSFYLGKRKFTNSLPGTRTQSIVSKAILLSMERSLPPHSIEMAPYSPTLYLMIGAKVINLTTRNTQLRSCFILLRTMKQSRNQLSRSVKLTMLLHG